MRVLVVDDDKTVCAILARTLGKRGYDVQTETQARRAISLIRDDDFDVVVLDLVMPDVNGLELLREIKEEFQNLPTVILTGRGDMSTAVEAMQAGASDFISKPIEGAFLDLRVRRAIELENARRMADTDALTGLYNHRFFHARLEQEIERSGRYGRPLTLMLLDIDHFKRVNDTYGHPQGDRILVVVADLFREASRTSDMVARYGGEEFAVILPETVPGRAEVFAERVQELLRKRFEAPDLAGQSEVTVSIGIAGLPPNGSKEGLVEAADQALYRAKREGRNRVCIAA